MHKRGHVINHGRKRANEVSHARKAMSCFCPAPKHGIADWPSGLPWEVLDLRVSSLFPLEFPVPFPRAAGQG